MASFEARIYWNDNTVQTSLQGSLLLRKKVDGQKGDRTEAENTRSRFDFDQLVVTLALSQFSKKIRHMTLLSATPKGFY